MDLLNSGIYVKKSVSFFYSHILFPGVKFCKVNFTLFPVYLTFSWNSIIFNYFFCRHCLSFNATALENSIRIVYLKSNYS